jgi:hypothetical protein
VSNGVPFAGLKEQIADLVEFLKALPYEDSEAAGKAAGLIKIER